LNPCPRIIFGTPPQRGPKLDNRICDDGFLIFNEDGPGSGKIRIDENGMQHPTRLAGLHRLDPAIHQTRTLFVRLRGWCVTNSVRAKWRASLALSSSLRSHC